MANNLYLFGIGGTGSRVIKSLTMLLATGVKLKDSEDEEINKVIPIIIDPDKSNGDLTRTSQILQNYQKIRKKLDFDKTKDNNFFRTDITALSDLSEAPNKASKTISDHFTFDLKGVTDQKFGDYINESSLDKSNKAFINLLFSEDNLNADMIAGFKGNPNIGSVVLNQLKDSKEFKLFASRYRDGDKIFIISSIFGGTGAAGFPLLVKNIRTAASPLQNPDLLRKATIGAVTVLPYFGVTTDNKSKINKATFVSKAKAALSYYSRNLSGNDSINALYYIGDDLSKDYTNQEGNKKQKNDAHFIELVAALSIIDFVEIDGLKTNDDGKAQEPRYSEYAIGKDEPKLNYSHLGKDTKSIIQKPLTQYLLFQKYLHEQLSDSIERQPWSVRGKIKIDKNFTSDPQSEFFEPLTAFNKFFAEWLGEIAGNERSFKPYKETTSSNLFKLLDEIDEKKYSLMASRGENYGLFDDRLNKYERQVGNSNVEQKFMSLFYLTTQDIISTKFTI